MPSMTIDIWSDVICPWCFLGKRRLEAAMAELDWRDEIEIHWHAYQLDPRATAEPKDLAMSIDAKYGPGSFVGMTNRLTALGEPIGIDYRFDRALRVSTLDAHRLLAWAWATAGSAKQGELKERLMLAYFTEGENVADHVVLERLAQDVGLDTQAVRTALASDAFHDEVRDDQRAAEEHQITGVPAFIVAGRVHIPGAQEVETFVTVLNRCRERFTDAD
jgi:predicted DsbA family dithiol-disulfide isomerase